ncbi:MAG: division/cell wall cluster transcriptional repressor MraZ [Treponema sp.]|nr:division/cell wall cluster transcriptional repressor MraZ [Treponema sp.]
MDLLTGEFENTLDEKGRISLPAKLRQKLSGSIVVLTKGYNNCVWVLPPEQWDSVAEKFIDASLTFEKADFLHHQFITSMQEVEIDRAGRIAIPLSLRKHAKLTRSCVILGTGKKMEIWDVNEYGDYLDANASRIKDILDELGPISLFI